MRAHEVECLPNSEPVSHTNRSRMTPKVWKPDIYARNARYVSDLGMPVLELLNPQPGERILDLGCGDGELTRVLQDRGRDTVGIDPSAEFIAAARKLGLDVREQDARELDFEDEFDAVFSNAVLHWIGEADIVLGNVHRALREGGRFVGEFGGYGNCASIEQALVDELELRGIDASTASPWYFPTAGEYGERLVAAGFRVPYIELIRARRRCREACRVSWRRSRTVLRRRLRRISARRFCWRFATGWSHCSTGMVNGPPTTYD